MVPFYMGRCYLNGMMTMTAIELHEERTFDMFLPVPTIKACTGYFLFYEYVKYQLQARKNRGGKEKIHIRKFSSENSNPPPPQFPMFSAK